MWDFLDHRLINSKFSNQCNSFFFFLKPVGTFTVTSEFSQLSLQITHLRIKKKFAVSRKQRVNSWMLVHLLTLHTCTLIFIFSTQRLSLHFLWYWPGEIVWLSQPSLVCNDFPYSHDLSLWFSSDASRRN